MERKATETTLSKTDTFLALKGTSFSPLCDWTEMMLRWAGRDYSHADAASPAGGAVCLLFADFTSKLMKRLSWTDEMFGEFIAASSSLVSVCA